VERKILKYSPYFSTGIYRFHQTTVSFVICRQYGRRWRDWRSSCQTTRRVAPTPGSNATIKSRPTTNCRLYSGLPTSP